MLALKKKMSNYHPASSPSQRETLLIQTLTAMPREMHQCVMQAFALFDNDVQRQKRSYAQVTVQDMKNIATNLYAQQPRVPTVPIQQPYVPCFNTAVYYPPQRYSPNVQHSGPPISNTSPLHPAQPSVVPNQQRKRSHYDAASHQKDRAHFLNLARGRNEKKEVDVHSSFVGCSTELERKYSRDAPTPDDIRPIPVLEKALSYIVAQARDKEKAEGQNAANKYLSDQLKGMRQDLRVQDIKNDFAVKVYEMHARLSLECEDLGEFNQCQAALKQLYLVPSIDRDKCSIAEFFCYRVVYLSLSQQIDSLSTELVHYTNLHLKRKEVKSIVQYIPRTMVQWALRLSGALDEGDIFTINAILQCFPVQMRYLLKIFLQKRRVKWFHALLSGIKGNISMHYVLASLGFLPTTHNDKKKGGKKANLLWLDETKEGSEEQIKDFFETIKFELPPSFSLDAVMLSEGKGVEKIISINAEEAKKVVDSYIAFLSTRHDATPTGDV